MLIAAEWKAPDYFYHLRSGGHVSAAKAHLGHAYFLNIDVVDFFGSINKSRVTRCLKPLLGYETARDIAQQSTVRHPGDARWMLPYGFGQSPILASICLERSALGRCISRINDEPDVAVSVYVDDILISGDSEKRLVSIAKEIEVAAARAKFSVTLENEGLPDGRIVAFNIAVTKGALHVVEERMLRFGEAYVLATSDAERAGILGYVTSINRNQAKELVGSSEEGDGDR